MLTAPEMAMVLRPTIGIQLAPPAVGCAAYLSVTSGPPDLLSHAMLGYAILQALLLIRLLPWIRQPSFAASYWGVTFGVTAAATASIRMVERSDMGAISTLAPALFAVANVVLIAVSRGTIILIWRGTLLPAPAK
jgi:tellurite resistance protein